MTFTLSCFKKTCITTSLILVLLSANIAQQPIYPALVGEELLDSVVSGYKPTTVLNYADARDLMYGVIYNENDTVRCVYTGHSLLLPTGVDPSTFLWMNGSADGINAEHTYPRSKGASEENGNAFSDMHHLFPCRDEVNGSRSNFPYAEIEDSQAKSWFYLDQQLEDIPSQNIELYSERKNGFFEPRESHKGNAARAVFYFYSMYEKEALEADPIFFEQQRETLCDWHKQDPVDVLEWDRTHMIADFQSGLPNPFVLDSTLVDRAYCNGIVSVTDTSDTSPISVFPNPITDWVNVKSPGNSSLLVVDVLGRTVLQKQFSDSMIMDFTALEPGHYIFTVNGQVFRVLKL